MKIFIFFAVFLSSCSFFKKREPVEPEQSDLNAIQEYEKTESRLFNHFVVGGMIVSRWIDGNGEAIGTEHEGEALLWTGVVMALLPCDDANLFENRLIRMLIENNGALLRYEPLGEYADGREVTIDGAIGFYHGLAYRLANCDVAEKWKNPWSIHLNYLSEHGEKLNEKAKDNAILPNEFTALRDAISHKLGFRGQPHQDRIKILETQVSAWAAAVVAKKSAAYRINLSFLTLQGLEFLGYKIDGSAFCIASKSAEIADVSHWCGNGDLLESFIENFRFNQYEYKFQRAKWENPDGKNGLLTPALDYLKALTMQYKGLK